MKITLAEKIGVLGVVAILCALIIPKLIKEKGPKPPPCVHQWMKWEDPKYGANTHEFNQIRRCEACGAAEFRWLKKSK